MKIYICGRISGLPLEEAYQKFDETEKKLKYEFPYAQIVNPMKLPHNHDKSWESYMRECLRHLLDCTNIYCIPEGLELSKGATLERHIAKKLNIIFI